LIPCPFALQELGRASINLPEQGPTRKGKLTHLRSLHQPDVLAKYPNARMVITQDTDWTNVIAEVCLIYDVHTAFYF